MCTIIHNIYNFIYSIACHLKYQEYRVRELLLQILNFIQSYFTTKKKLH